MAWPDKMVSRFMATFFHYKFQENVQALLFGNVLIKHMNFFPRDASQEVKDHKAIMAAGESLKFLAGMSIELEDDGDRGKAFEALSKILSDGEKNSSEIPKIIDEHYKFFDEEGGNTNG